MRLAVITDEIHDDLEHALRVAAELGLREVELNHLWGRSVVDLFEDELAKAERLLADGSFRVCAVGTMAFKSVLLDGLPSPEESPEFREHREWVRRGCDLAKRFGAPLVRVFSFRRSGMIGMGNPSPREPGGGSLPEEMLPKIVAGLRQAADIAGEAGVVLIVENVRSCWGNSCRNTARILEAAEHLALKAVWDPGNDYVSGGNPYPDGYEAIRPWLAHVHVKNAAVADAETGLTRWERIGAGDLDYRPMLSRLKTDKYEGAVVLETHWRGEGLTAEESSRRSFSDLRSLWDELT